MSKKQNVLYIPGLGGAKSDSIQRKYVGLLSKLQRRNYYFFDANWQNQDGFSEDYQQKIDRLNEFYLQCGKPEIIFGCSAGASLSITLSQKNQTVNKCHVVCGKILGAEKIGNNYSNIAPALIDAVAKSTLSANNIDAKKVICYVPKNTKNDGVIEVKDMVINGSKIVYLPKLNHTQAIIYAILRYLHKL